MTCSILSPDPITPLISKVGLNFHALAKVGIEHAPAGNSASSLHACKSFYMSTLFAVLVAAHLRFKICAPEPIYCQSAAAHDRPRQNLASTDDWSQSCLRSSPAVLLMHNHHHTHHSVSKVIRPAQLVAKPNLVAGPNFKREWLKLYPCRNTYTLVHYLCIKTMVAFGISQAGLAQ